MSYWNQKNTFCYNSRLTEHEFQFLASCYCRGLSATQTSREFKEGDISISRQTISKYFGGIAYVLLCERETYPWWSVDHWSEITDEQFEDIRKAVYGENQILPRLRKELHDITGQPITVDNELFIKILRDMSVTQNGLYKQNFISSLARACELAWFLHELEGCTMEFAQTLLYNLILNIFKNGRTLIFKRKESPRTRAINDEYYSEDNSDARIYDHIRAMKDYGASDEYKKKKEWLGSLTEADKIDLEKKQRLSVFTGKIKLPPERNY